MSSTQPKHKNAKGTLRNQKGQGLIEYIILVALIAIASIGVMRVLSQTANTQLANITNSLQGGAQARKIAAPQVSETLYSKKDLSDFMKNATKDGRSSK
ncbi:MAG: Flp family type IVb pilin [Bdellovibrionaceae bacterium]|nr:Flp family type IVb pilin [Pseudobdellovibrionaceae bacterium]